MQSSDLNWPPRVSCDRVASEQACKVTKTGWRTARESVSCQALVTEFRARAEHIDGSRCERPPSPMSHHCLGPHPSFRLRRSAVVECSRDECREAAAAGGEYSPGGSRGATAQARFIGHRGSGPAGRARNGGRRSAHRVGRRADRGGARPADAAGRSRSHQALGLSRSCLHDQRDALS